MKNKTVEPLSLYGICAVCMVCIAAYGICRAWGETFPALKGDIRRSTIDIPNAPALDRGSIIGKKLKDGKLILNYRWDEPQFYPEGVETQVHVWQEIYGCSNGLVILEENVDAHYTPSRNIPERIEWKK